MPITNYTELQTAVGRWLQRTDLSALIPDFIANAEAEFNRTLRLTGQLVRRDVTVTDRWTDISGLTVPLAEIRSVSVTTGGVRKSLQFLTPDFAQQWYASGVPAYYSRNGNELEILPPPDATYTVEVLYWRKIPPLATNSTNFLLELAPDLYLYRSVLEGAQYVHASELVARVGPMYDRALAQVKADDKGRQFGGSALQIKVA